jgi:hypothetical protein
MDPRRSNGVVRVIVDGVPKLFQMDKNLIRALDNTEAQLVDPFKKAAANAAASLRFGATAGNPEFILTNFFRDQGIAGIQSRNGYLPIISGMWGAFKMLSDPKAFQEWQLAGGATAAMMPLTRKNLRLTVDTCWPRARARPPRRQCSTPGTYRSTLNAWAKSQRRSTNSSHSSPWR